MNNSIFNKNSLFTVGIEEEYMLCDPKSFDLVPKANELMAQIDSKSKERYSYELILSEIESNTKVCDNVNDAIIEISKHRNELKYISKKNNCLIGISGTHPTALPREQTFVNNASYKWVANQLQYYAKRNITFSTHIHIGVDDPEKSIKICNSLRRWIAPMLALSANSPFFEGSLTGMCSSRTLQFNSFPRTEIPNYIHSYKEYLNIIDNYIKSDSIEKPRQIWWKIRPHIEYGTIEFRMCDAQRSLANVKMLAGLAQALVHTIYKKDDYTNCLYKNEYLNDSLWKASRFGLQSKIIDPGTEKIIDMIDFVETMYSYCSDSLNYFKNKDIIQRIKYLLKNNTEYHRQMNIYNAGGMNELKKFLIDDVEYSLK